MLTSQSVASMIQCPHCLYSFSCTEFILVLPSSHSLFLPQDLLSNISSTFRIHLEFTFFRKPFLTFLQRPGPPDVHFHGTLYLCFTELFMTEIKNIKPDCHIIKDVKISQKVQNHLFK